jgi:hypothetical protein
MPTIITKTIGPVGRDYTTFTAAEAAVATIPTTDDMVLNDEAIVFEVDAGTYNEAVTFDSSTPGPALTMDATRNITYRAAAGSEHGGISGAGVRIQFGNTAISSTCVTVVDDFVALDNLEIEWTGPGAGQRTLDAQVAGLLVRNCLLSNTGPGVVVFATASTTADSATYPMTFQNCVLDGNGPGFRIWNYGASDKGYTVTNCTITCVGRAFDIFSATNDTTYTFTNNLVLAASDVFLDQGGGGVSTVLGSNNVGGSTGPFPVALQAESQTWTFSTDPLAVSTGSQAIYDATTGALVNVPGNDAVGVGTTTGAPTTDINGEDRIRGTFADPGAFVAPLRTIGKTIDAAGGGDYTTFVAAEAAVVGLSTNGNLVERNESIVFEAEAGTYGGLACEWTLITDATRSVTFRAAAGSEHSGVFGSGVVLQDIAANVAYLTIIANSSTNHAIFDGLTYNVPAGEAVRCTSVRNGVGCIWRNCLMETAGTANANESSDTFTAGSASDPVLYENCVVKSGTQRGWLYNSNGTGTYVRIVNCTLWTGSEMLRCYTYPASSQAVEVVNCLNLSGNTSFVDGGPVATVVTGSGNVGGVTNPFPVAQQAESQTWTFSTNPADPSTGSQVIYDATNGAMVDAPGNDAWKILTDLSVAPTTDIEGVTREATGYNPGAFERTAADVGTPLDGGVDYLRDLNIRDRFLRGAAIREPFIRNLRD